MRKPMGWLVSIAVALLTGALGLVGAGAVANACVSWYRISGFEGKSGYFVIGMALLGGIAGTIAGLVCARIVASWPAPSFLKGVGLSWGVVAGVTAAVAAIAWALADIPPEVDGKKLDLEVEFRLPAGEAEPPAAGESAYVSLAAASGQTVRRTERGELHLDAARREDGRWIVPGEVLVFTTRGSRILDLVVGGETLAGFIVPLPRRPGAAEREWSDWLPHPRPPAPPWPNSKVSYRFRVRPIEPPPPPPDPEEVAARELAALQPTAPLPEWLRFVRYDQPEDRIAAAMRTVEGRQPELAASIRSADAAEREDALIAVVRLTRVEPEVTAAVLEDGRAIAAGIRAFNEMKEDDPRFWDVQIELRGRFNDWHRAWWTVHRRTGADGRPPVQEILELARVRAGTTTMDEIVVNAQAHLDGLAPASTPAPTPSP
jgi:hypothetical protein